MKNEYGRIACILAGSMLVACPALAGVHKELRFPKGTSSTTIQEAVVRGERDRYLVGAAKGQYLSVRVEALEDNAVVDVLSPGANDSDETDIRGIALPGAKEVKSTVVQLPVDGKYMIVVGGTRGNASYKLTVAITNQRVEPSTGVTQRTGELETPKNTRTIVPSGNQVSPPNSSAPVQRQDSAQFHEKWASVCEGFVKAAGESSVSSWAAAATLHIGGAATKARKALAIPACQSEAQIYSMTKWKILTSYQETAELRAADWVRSRDAGHSADAKILEGRAIAGYRLACKQAADDQAWLVEQCPQLKDVRN